MDSLRLQRQGAVDYGDWWGKDGVPAAMPTRQFHLIGVGLPKTGTISLAYLFEPFRWGAEFLFAETVERLIAWRSGTLTQGAMRHWLALRAEAGALELDSASFNHFFIDILVELHPAARFVYTRRDAVSWADSFLNMLLRQSRYQRGRPWPEWQLALGRLMAPSFDPGQFVSPGRLYLALYQLADELLGFYARETARIETALPPERSLVIPTDGLSTRLDVLAAFAGVPRSALSTARSHANRGPGKIPLVAALPDLAYLLEQNGLARVEANRERD
ncbi:MAG: sulfotransferase [Rubrobacter sp.]